MFFLAVSLSTRVQAILSVDVLLTGTADTTKDIAVAQKSSMSAATLIFVVSFVGEYFERERERERELSLIHI